MTTSRIQMNQTLRNGTKIYGKWHHHSYEIISYVGHGTQGDVYLAHSKAGRVAIKFPREHSTMSMEMNVLKQLKKVQGISRGPSLYEIEDWATRGKILPFYVMEYIEGDTFRRFVQRKGFEWACVLMVQMLGELQTLHEAGWVFGDLKPDNLIVEGHSNLRWLDPGGITKMNRSVREYSILYDRGYWKCGTRKADPGYDMFATALILIEAAINNQWDKKHQGNPAWLFSVIKKNKQLTRVQPVLEKALKGRYSSALMMKKELLLLLSETYSTPERKKATVTISRTKRRRKKRFIRLLAIWLFFIMIIGGVVFYYWMT